MGNCPYCKRIIGINDIKIEEKGIGFIEKEKMYIYSHCDTILGFSSKMR